MTDRDHWVYVEEDGTDDEHTDDCPGCHWEGNLDCEALLAGCDICDPDGTYIHGAYQVTSGAAGRLALLVRMWRTHQTYAEKLFVRTLAEERLRALKEAAR